MFFEARGKLCSNYYNAWFQDSTLRRTDSDSDLCIDERQAVPTSIDPQVNVYPLVIYQSFWIFDVDLIMF